MGVLHTFAKKSKWAPASISSVDVKRVLREVNRRASKKYRLEHVRGHQDRMKRISHTPMFKLLSPLDRWLYPLARVWGHYFDEDTGRV